MKTIETSKLKARLCPELQLGWVVNACTRGPPALAPPGGESTFVRFYKHADVGAAPAVARQVEATGMSSRRQHRRSHPQTFPAEQHSGHLIHKLAMQVWKRAAWNCLKEEVVEESVFTWNPRDTGGLASADRNPSLIALPTLQQNH